MLHRLPARFPHRRGRQLEVELQKHHCGGIHRRLLTSCCCLVLLVFACFFLLVFTGSHERLRYAPSLPISALAQRTHRLIIPALLALPTPTPHVSAVDAYEFSALVNQQLNLKQLTGRGPDGGGDGDTVEYKPHFHEWATVQPGMICLARKKKTAVFRQYIAAETAVPVIACAACLPKDDEKNYFFAGVARSKSVRSPDDGIGPNVDEFFTVSIGGMATILNTSMGPIFPGDLVEWCLSGTNASKGSRAKQGPRRVGIQVASVSSPKIIGRALSVSHISRRTRIRNQVWFELFLTLISTASQFSKNGETFDVSTTRPCTHTNMLTNMLTQGPMCTYGVHSTVFAGADPSIGTRLGVGV